MKKLKNILLSILTLAIFMSFGLSDKMNVYAEENTTIIFHYTSTDLSSCTIAIWEDGGTATNYGFTINGTEGTVTYKCKGADIQEVGYTVKDPAYENNADTNAPRKVDISKGASVIDVYLTPGSVEVETIVGTEVSAETTVATETTTPATEPETTVVNAETTTSGTQTETTTAPVAETTNKVGDDPNADYSPSTVMIIIIDIVFIAAIAGISYVACNKNQNK